MYVCMYVCMHVRTSVYIYMYLYTYVRLSVYANTRERYSLVASLFVGGGESGPRASYLAYEYRGTGKCEE